MPKPILYWWPGTCARVTFVALEEIGAPFEDVVVNLSAKHDPAYREYCELNPKGKVPALVFDGRVYTENPAIQTFLAHRYPDVGLLPNGNQDLEQRALEIMSWFAAGVHPAITRQRFPRFFAAEHPAAWPAIQLYARSQLEEAFSILESELEGRNWLLGDWTILDVYMLWLWFRATGAGMDGRPFPNCIAHARRCEERPSVAKVLAREEREIDALKESGRVPDWYPQYQAGHAPRFD